MGWAFEFEFGSLCCALSAPVPGGQFDLPFQRPYPTGSRRVRAKSTGTAAEAEADRRARSGTCLIRAGGGWRVGWWAMGRGPNTRTNRRRRAAPLAAALIHHYHHYHIHVRALNPSSRPGVPSDLSLFLYVRPNANPPMHV